MSKLTPDLVRAELAYNQNTGDFIRLVARGGSRVGEVAGSIYPIGYRYINVCGEEHPAHRLAWFVTHGEWPIEIDHINHEKWDNRLVNLRNVTRTGNSQNLRRRRDNTTGCPGVYWFARVKKWTAAIGVAGKQKHLGYFAEYWDAVCARKRAELAYFVRPNT